MSQCRLHVHVNECYFDLQEEDYPGAIDLCLECEKAARAFKHYNCIRYNVHTLYKVQCTYTVY